MDLVRLMTQAKQIEVQKLKGRDRSNKKARTRQFEYGQLMSEGGNHSQFQNYLSMIAPSY